MLKNVRLLHELQIGDPRRTSTWVARVGVANLPPRSLILITRDRLEQAVRDDATSKRLISGSDSLRERDDILQFQCV